MFLSRHRKSFKQGPTINTTSPKNDSDIREVSEIKAVNPKDFAEKISKPLNQNKESPKLETRSGKEYLEYLLEDYFIREKDATRVCDAYYAYRARMTEAILQLSQGSRGNYLIYDPTRKYHLKFLGQRPIMNKLPVVNPEVVFSDNPFANTNRTSAQYGWEICEKEAEDTPAMKKFALLLMDGDLVPDKLKRAAATDAKLRRNVLKVIDKGIKGKLATDKIKVAKQANVKDIAGDSLNILKGMFMDKYMDYDRKFWFSEF